MKLRVALLALLLLTYPIVTGWMEVPGAIMKRSDFYAFGIVPKAKHYRMFGQVRVRVQPEEDFQYDKTFGCSALLDGSVTVPLGTTALEEDMADTSLPPAVSGTLQFEQDMPIKAYWILECGTDADGVIYNEHVEVFMGRPDDGTS